MSAQQANKYLALAATGLTALEAIGDMVQIATGGTATVNEALTILHTIDAIVSSVRAGLAGETTPEAVARAVAELQGKITRNDQTADAALAAKFPAP